jgi:hypothetical protein
MCRGRGRARIVGEAGGVSADAQRTISGLEVVKRRCGRHGCVCSSS